jgi:hypothetical protein
MLVHRERTWEMRRTLPTMRVFAVALAASAACGGAPLAASPALFAPTTPATPAPPGSGQPAAAPISPGAAVLELADVRIAYEVPYDALIAWSDGRITDLSGTPRAMASRDGRIVDRYGKDLARLAPDGSLTGLTDEPLRLEPDGDARGASSGTTVHVDDRGVITLGGRAIEGYLVKYTSSPPSPAARRVATLLVLLGKQFIPGPFEKAVFDDPACESFSGIGLGTLSCKCAFAVSGRSYALSCRAGSPSTCTCSQDGQASPPRTVAGDACSSVLTTWSSECGFPGRRLKAGHGP